MSLRLLYFTDLHARGTNPRARKDNYMETMHRKLAEVRQMVADHNCTAVLFGGDLTDTPDISESTLGDLIKDMRAFPVQIYGVWGNTHDIWGDEPATLRRTALGVVEAAGAITLLRPGEATFLGENGFTVQITGQGYHPDMDRRDWRLDYCVGGGSIDHLRRPDVRWALHIVHGMLRTKPLMAGVPVTLVSDVLRETSADITFSGHDHMGFGVVQQDDRYACNPGALMRVTAAREEITRPVQVALITLTADTCHVELIPLQSAAPGEEILDRSQLEAQALKTAAMDEFLASVKSGGDFEAIDLPAVIRRIAANKGVSRQVLDETLTRVYAAIEAGGSEEA